MFWLVKCNDTLHKRFGPKAVPLNFCSASEIGAGNVDLCQHVFLFFLNNLKRTSH